VGGDEVDVFLGIEGAAFAGGVGDRVSQARPRMHSVHFTCTRWRTGTVVEDEVVTEAVSPGLGDTESEIGGFGEEGVRP
jgi:hypothetical protein